MTDSPAPSPAADSLVSRIDRLLASIPGPVYYGATEADIRAQMDADTAAAWSRLAVQDWESQEFIGAAICVMTSLLSEAAEQLRKAGG